MIVGAKDSGNCHVIVLGNAYKFPYRVSGINNDAFTCYEISDEIDEIDHLVRHLIGGGEVTPRQKLFEVQTINHSTIVAIYDMPMKVKR